MRIRSYCLAVALWLKNNIRTTSENGIRLTALRVLYALFVMRSLHMFACRVCVCAFCPRDTYIAIAQTAICIAQIMVLA